MKCIALALGTLPFLTLSPAFAQSEPSPFELNLDSSSISTSASLGWLRGEAEELVYNPNGSKLSQLNWKFNGVNILKADIAWEPFNWLTASARGWMAISKGNSDMDDYDWLSPNQSNWSHHSEHPDTRLQDANEYDLNLKGWVVQQSGLKLGVTGGFQQTTFSWDAYNGSYNYDNGQDVGTFNEGKVISYKQTFKVPYIGLAAGYRYQDLEVNAQVKYSEWVDATGEDVHHLRNLGFADDQSGSKYYGASMDVGYYLLSDLKIFTELAWNDYREKVGDSRATNHATGVTTDHGSSTGLSNTNYNASLGLQYRF
ncbi:plasminogen activator [Pseudomonas sp. TE3786]